MTEDVLYFIKSKLVNNTMIHAREQTNMFMILVKIALV
jgi:hypothetical protein